MTKLKKYQVEENNNSDLSIVKLINKYHEVDKDDSNKQNVKLRLYKVDNYNLQKKNQFQNGNGIYNIFTLYQEGKMMMRIWNMVRCCFFLCWKDQ